MPFRGVFFLYTLVLIAGFSLSIPTFAEHATGPTTPESTNVPPPAGGVLTDNEMKAVSWFGLPESVIRGRWNSSLPSAIEKAMKDKDEDGVAKILATLTGTINATQLLEIQKLAVQKGQGLEQGNNRYAQLLKRLAWLKEIKFPGGPTLPIFKPEGEEFQKFKTAFDRHWVDVQRRNEEFYRLLADANNPNSATREQSKAELLKFGGKELMSFLAGQAATGNDGVVNAFGRATGFDAGGGKSFVDAAMADGRLVRINHDTGKLAESIRQFDRSGNGNARDLTFSPTRHTGTPNINFTPSATPTSNTPPPNPPTNTPTNPPAQPNAVTIGQDVLKARCLSCHNSQRRRGGFEINSNGSLRDPSMLARVIARAVVGSEAEGGPMPPTGFIPDADREKLRNWARAANVPLR